MKKKSMEIIASKLLSSEEQNILFAHLRKTDKQLLLICDIMLNTGIRISELCRLKVKDTNYVLKQLCIDIIEGKGKKSDTIPISQRLANRITEFIQKDRPALLPHGVKHHDYERHLFYNEHGRCCKPPGIRKRLRKAAIESGMTRRVKPHMFRHSCCTDNAVKGIGSNILQHLMRHRDIRTTQIYEHLALLRINNLGDAIDHGDLGIVNG